MSGLIEGNLPYIPTDYVRHPEFLATTFSREIISDNLICVQRLKGGGFSHTTDLAHLCDFEGGGQKCGAGGGSCGRHRARIKSRPHIWLTLCAGPHI